MAVFVVDVALCVLVGIVGISKESSCSDGVEMAVVGAVVVVAVVVDVDVARLLLCILFVLTLLLLPS